MAEADLDTPHGVNGSANPQAPPAATPQLHPFPSQLEEYLSSLLSVTLGADRSDLEAEGGLLSGARHGETIERCLHFLSSPRVALYAQKHRGLAVESDGTSGPQGRSSTH